MILLTKLDFTKIAENRVRLQLPDFDFVQVLAGPHEGRNNLSEWLLILIAWITVVIGPLVLLLLTQLQFLPYHLAWATWAQRTVIVLDIAVLWCFWPDILPRTRLGRGPFSARRIVAAFVSTALIGFSIAIATFPGEAVYENWIARNIRIPEAPVSKGSAPPLVAPHIEKLLKGQFLAQYPGRPLTTVSLTKYLFEGGIDEVKPTGWFSNRLILLDQELVDTDKLQRNISKEERERKFALQGERTRILRGRDLRGAWLNGADLRRADLTGVQLQGASLWNAQLQGAILDRAQLQGASLYMAHLQGAALRFAQLQGARS